MAGNIYKDTGASGLIAYGGQIMNDYLPRWNGRTKWALIEEISNSPIGGAIDMSISLPLMRMSWTVIGPDEAGDDDPALAIVNDSLESMTAPFTQHIAAAVRAVTQGVAIFTTTYQRDNGRILLKKLREIGPATVMKWNLDDDGGWRSIQQYSYLQAEPIPIERTVIYRFYIKDNNPEGRSIYRPAYKSYYYADNLQAIEAIGAERAHGGLPVITPPMGADMSESGSETTDYGRAFKLVRNVRQDQQAGVVMPAPLGEGDHQRWHFELMGSPAAGTNLEAIGNIVARHEKRMLTAALSQFLLLGQDSVGALATFSGGADFHSMMIEALADSIAGTFTKFVIAPLLRLNGYDPAGYHMTHSPAGSVSTEEIAKLLQMAGPMLTWGEDDELWLRQTMRMPEPTADDLRMRHDERAEAERAQVERAAEMARQEQRERQAAEQMTANFWRKVQVGQRYNEDKERSGLFDALTRLGAAARPEKPQQHNYTINVPQQPPAAVSVHAAPVSVTVEKPDPARFVVQMPDQPAPVVHVEARQR